MRRFFLLLSMPLVAAACRNNSEQGSLTIPFVREVIADPGSPENVILSGYDLSRAYSIYVIGEPEEAQRYASTLTQCDAHDNVTGNISSDGLPDFSGETVVTLQDFAHAPYSAYLAGGREEELRELFVRECVDALDTACFLSPYDREGRGSRKSAKLIILASSFASGYGMYDVDSLYSAMGLEVKVLNPLSSMIASARKTAGSAIGVLASESQLSAGLYAGLYAFPRNEEPGADQLISFLDKYLDAGHTEPLGAIILDDPECSAEEMAGTLERIFSVMNEESFKYSRIITSDFKIIDPESTIASECFKIMREDNLFTHYIAYPKEEKLMSVASSDSPGYMIIPFNEKFLQADVQIDSTSRGN